jgi:hypothetical protein
MPQIGEKVHLVQPDYVLDEQTGRWHPVSKCFEGTVEAVDEAKQTVDVTVIFSQNTTLTAHGAPFGDGQMAHSPTSHVQAEQTEQPAQS